MRPSTIASVVMASLAASQSLADLPSCSLPCLNDAVEQSTCSATDVVCICQEFDIIQGTAAGCILGACGPDVALNKVLPVTQKLCAYVDSGRNANKFAPTPAEPEDQTGTVLPVTSQESTQEPTAEPTSPPAATVSLRLWED